MVSIEKFIAGRANIIFYQGILGRSQISLLRLLSPNGLRISELRILFNSLYTYKDLLRNKITRNKIFELLRENEAIELVRILKLQFQNPYEALFKTSFRKNSKKEQLLFSFFSIVQTEEYQPEAEPDILFIKPNYALFAHQIDVCKKAMSLLNDDLRRCIIHMPTGSGKTRTAMNLIAEYLRANGGLVVWLVYSSELCDQAVEEFNKSWSSLGNKELPIYKYWGSHSFSLNEIHEGVLVAGFNKLYNVFKDNHNTILSLGRKTSLIVIDEAHQSIAPTFKTVIESLSTDPKTRMLGLTATPGRTTDDIDADSKLASFFKKRKVNLDIPGYTNPVQYLIDEGYLAKAEFRSLSYDGTIMLTDNEKAQIANNLDIPLDILEKVAQNEQRNLKILFETKKLIEAGHSRLILFATTVDHAKELSAILNIQSIKSRCITAETKTTERKNIINEYKSNDSEPFVLCNYGVLTTGFDAPRTSAAIIARPTKSLVLYSQMVGRAIRGPKAGGNEKATILTTVDFDLPGFDSVQNAFLNWDDVYTQ